MKTLKVLLIFFIPLVSQAKLVEISKSIVIDSNIETVFHFVKNTMNDSIWRSEVNTMAADGDFEVGTIYTEDARIGLNRNFITRTKLVSVIDNHHAYYITPKDEPFYLSSLRSVSRLGRNRTEFTYTVKFDQKMSKKAFGVNIPVFAMKLVYGEIMMGYLRKLRRHLE